MGIFGNQTSGYIPMVKSKIIENLFRPLIRRQQILLVEVKPIAGINHKKSRLVSPNSLMDMHRSFSVLLIYKLCIHA